MGIAAAAAIGGVASLGGALLTSSAASKASQQQAQSAQNAINEQMNMFGVAQGALSPYYTAGAANIPNLKNAIAGVQPSLSTLQGLTNPGTANQTLSSLPGFQFQSQWGTKTAQNALAAEGLGGSTGPLATAISQYNTGLAGTYLNSAVGNAATAVNAGLGVAGANQNLVNSGLSAGGALTGAAINTGQGIGQTQQNLGTAQASGTLGSANALAGGLTGGAGSISNALLLNSLISNGGSSNGLYGGFNLGGASPNTTDLGLGMSMGY